MPVLNPPCFDGLQIVGAAHDSLNVSIVDPPVWPGAAPIVTNGSYYIDRWTAGGGDTDQLCEQFEAALDGVAGVNCEVTRNTATGYVTVTNNHGANPLSVRFIDHTGSGVVDVGVMLGLIAPTAGASPVIGPIAAAGGTFTGPYQHYFGWYPDRPTTNMDGFINAPGVVRSDGVVTVASSGRVVTTKFFERTERGILLKQLASRRVMTDPAGTTYTSYQQFWQRIVSLGMPARFYHDRADIDGPAGTGPTVYQWDQRMVAGGTTEAVVKRTSAFYDELYDVEIGCHLSV